MWFGYSREQGGSCKVPRNRGNLAKSQGLTQSLRPSSKGTLPMGRSKVSSWSNPSWLLTTLVASGWHRPPSRLAQSFEPSTKVMWPMGRLQVPMWSSPSGLPVALVVVVDIILLPNILRKREDLANFFFEIYIYIYSNSMESLKVTNGSCQCWLTPSSILIL